MSRLSDADKIPVSCYYNEDAGTINVSSSNSTVDSNAANPVNLYDMFKRKRGATQELENDLLCSSSVEEEGCSKKKLRLSREQCGLLEEIFLRTRPPNL